MRRTLLPPIEDGEFSHEIGARESLAQVDEAAEVGTFH